MLGAGPVAIGDKRGNHLLQSLKGVLRADGEAGVGAVWSRGPRGVFWGVAAAPRLPTS